MGSIQPVSYLLDNLRLTRCSAVKLYFFLLSSSTLKALFLYPRQNPTPRNYSNIPGLLCGHSLAFIKYELESRVTNKFLSFALYEGYSTTMVYKMCKMIHWEVRKVTVKLCFLVFTLRVSILCFKTHTTCKYSSTCL